MTLLLVKILVLLLLSAMLGAGLARWYLRRRYEDVTVQYTSWQSDWANWRRQLDRRFSETHQGSDLTPLLSRLEHLENTVHDARDVPPSLELDARLQSIEEALRALLAAHKVVRP